MPLPASLKATTPADLDITIVQGSTYYAEYQFLDAGSPIDLTGCTATAKLRTDFAAVGELATFTCSIPSPTTGTVRLVLLPATTTALTATFPDASTRSVVFGVWDFEVTDGTDTVRGAQGKASLSREVTK